MSLTHSLLKLTVISVIIDSLFDFATEFCNHSMTLLGNGIFVFQLLISISIAKVTCRVSGCEAVEFLPPGMPYKSYWWTSLAVLPSAVLRISSLAWELDYQVLHRGLTEFWHFIAKRVTLEPVQQQGGPACMMRVVDNWCVKWGWCNYGQCYNWMPGNECR